METTTLFSQVLETPIGKMVAIASNKGLCALEFLDDNKPFSLFPKEEFTIIESKNEFTEQAHFELNEYFDKKRKVFDIPLDLLGTEFQIKVWNCLLLINYGKLSSYEEQAAKLGNPLAIRAMAHANGQNKLAIIVPCHRVIGKNGSMTGYAGGIWRKEWLLNHEGSVKTSLKFDF